MSQLQESNRQVGTNSNQKAYHSDLNILRAEIYEKIDNKLQTDKASLITVFGTFASLLAFLTVEFQFLKTIETIEKITGFTLVLFCLLISFNLILDYVVQSRMENRVKAPNIFIVLILIIVFGLGIFFSAQENWSNKKINDANNLKLEGQVELLQKQISELKKAPVLFTP